MRSCSDCAKWLYDDKGTLHKTRAGLPILRPPGTATPCHSCPKESPAKAHEHELTAKNRRLVAFYYEARAAGFRVPMDDATREKLSIIDGMVRQAESKQLAQSVALELLPFFVKR